MEMEEAELFETKEQHKRKKPKAQNYEDMTNQLYIEINMADRDNDYSALQ